MERKREQTGVVRVRVSEREWVRKRKKDILMKPEDQIVSQSNHRTSARASTDRIIHITLCIYIYMARRLGPQDWWRRLFKLKINQTARAFSRRTAARYRGENWIFLFLFIYKSGCGVLFTFRNTMCTLHENDNRTADVYNIIIIYHTYIMCARERAVDAELMAAIHHCVAAA